MTTRTIGLSLGADICWPAAYEDLLERLDLHLEVDGEPLDFACERIQVEPFDLRYKPRYDLVIDRLTHWFGTTREWVKKIMLMDGVYVLNNPWAIQSMEKHTSYCAMMRLGFPVPTTVMLPPKAYRDEGDVRVTTERYNKMFDLGRIGEQVGYPAFLKPYDGGGWVGVRRVTDAASLMAAYDDSGERVNHLQAAVRDWDVFVRGLGVGPQVNLMRYDPDAPLHGRYLVDLGFLDDGSALRATQITRVINAFFRWDFNSAEMLRVGDVLHPIDYANACPDSQVTSLHFHFPWLVKALLRWTVFSAATRRRPSLNLDWQPYFDIADEGGTFEENLPRYDALAQAHFDVERFESFCAEHLADLDEIALDYFGSERFREVVRSKVTALFPAHEVEEFTAHFFGLVEFWRKVDRDRIDARPRGEP